MEIIDADRGDAGLVAEHRAADRLVRKGSHPQIVEDDVGWGVARLAKFLEDDLLFAGEIVGLEMRREDHVGDHLDPERQMFGEQGRGKARALAVGGGIEIAADILDRLADLARRSRAGALEHHMFVEVGDAVQARRLMTRAGLGIKADRDGLDPRHRAAGDTKAVGKGGELHGHERPDLGAQGSGGNLRPRRASAMR